MIRDLIKDLLKYVPAQIVPALVGLVAIPIVTRLFPPSDYGNYSLVMATVNILAIVALGWVTTSIIRFYPAYEKDGRLEEFHGSAVKILFISAIAYTAAFLGILFAIRPWISSELWQLMLIGTLLFFLLSGFQGLQQLLRAERLVSWYSGFQVWYKAAALGIGITLVLCFHFGIEGLLWGSILSLAIALPLLWKTAAGGRGVLKNRGISIELTREMAKYGFPLVVGNLSAWILSVSDRYVIEGFRGAQEVGIYSAIYAISEASILLIATLFLLAYGPISMHIWEKEGVERSQEFLTKLTRYYLIVCLPLTVGMAVLAKPAIEILLAPEYREGYRIVALVASGGFLLGLQQRFQSGLIFYKKTSYIMVSIIVAGLLNVGLNFWLVPKYGYMGAAVTTLISYIFLLIVITYASRKYFVWEFPYKSLGKVTLASAAMGAVTYWVGNNLTSSNLTNLAVGVVVGVLVYLIMLVLLGEYREEEIRALRNIWNRLLRRSSG